MGNIGRGKAKNRFLTRRQLRFKCEIQGTGKGTFDANGRIRYILHINLLNLLN